MDKMLYRYGIPGVVIVFTAVVAVTGHLRNMSAVQVLVPALVAGGLSAWLGFAALNNASFTGIWRQHMTWDVYRSHTWEPHESEMAAEVEQMRKVEARAAHFAAAHGMERISLAVTGARLGWWGAAESTRSSKTHGHIELGHAWFFPEGRPSLPHIVEHELAHIQRNDSRTYVITASATSALTVASAGLLPLPYAAAAIAALLVARSAMSWRAELACDAMAARQCGRTDAVTALTHFLAEARALPPLARLLHTAKMLRSHPPIRLRRWWVRQAPAAPVTGSETTTAAWGGR